MALVSVFPYHPLEDPTGSELSRVREEGRGILLELGESAGLEPIDTQVIASNLVGRELQRVTEQDTTGVVVLGSTGRGAVGRILPGAMAERLLAGAGAPLAIATRGYAESGEGAPLQPIPSHQHLGLLRPCRGSRVDRALPLRRVDTCQ